VYSVSTEDDIQLALETMQKHKVRRLPVIDAEGQLHGIISMNDVVLNAREPEGKKTPAVGYADVVRTYQAICEHPQPLQAAAAGAT
jgi:CBS domain-containing protein